MTEDLSKKFDEQGYAIFLPAISTFYNNYIARQRVGPYVEQSRFPKSFNGDMEALNFLDPIKSKFHYKYGLYSAGHAQLNMARTNVEDAMIQQRDRKNTVILGDSGGFQIGKGILKFDWKKFKTPSTDKVILNILDWLEETADWSMILDVPAWASNPSNSPRTGLKSFQDCLDATVYNNNLFIKNRKGKTKFLNVLQGDDWEKATAWYDAVKSMPFEGWAMGSKNASDMYIALKRIIILRDEKLLDERNWMHFLGTAQLDWSVYLTAIQRQLRKTVNPNINLSFDCASPFIATANGRIYTDTVFSKKKLTIRMDFAPDNKLLKNSQIPFPWESAITKDMTMGDVCYYGPTDMNKIGKIGKTSWDSFSYALMMGHNVYTHIKSVEKANQLADIEYVTHKPEWKHWRKLKDSDRSDDYSDWIPRNLLYFNGFVKDLFESETPMDMLDEARAFLDSCANTRWRKSSHFDKFFDTGETSVINDPAELEHNEDAIAKLEELENSIKAKNV